MYESNNVELSKYNVMKAFWEEVAGKDKVRFGGGYSMMPLNYKTDTKEELNIKPIKPILSASESENGASRA